MNFLVDTHILIWSFIKPENLTHEIKEALLNENNEIYYSQISLWEIAIKYTLGKLVLKGMSPEEFFEEIENSFYKLKKLENYELISFYRLPVIHKDPFDRMLIWQSIKNEMVFISSDNNIKQYNKYGLKSFS
jgi:PIN domain nuclease of toxin-antitoxin system